MRCILFVIISFTKKHSEKISVKREKGKCLKQREIESWLWLSGKTKEHTKALKDAGCRLARKRRCGTGGRLMRHVITDANAATEPWPISEKNMVPPLSAKERESRLTKERTLTGSTD